MTDVTISKQRLRELEITAEMGTNIVTAISKADGDIFEMLEGVQQALATYLARVALMEAMQ